MVGGTWGFLQAPEQPGGSELPSSLLLVCTAQGAASAIRGLAGVSQSTCGEQALGKVGPCFEPHSWKRLPLRLALGHLGRETTMEDVHRHFPLWSCMLGGLTCSIPLPLPPSSVLPSALGASTECPAIRSHLGPWPHSDPFIHSQPGLALSPPRVSLSEHTTHRGSGITANKA